MAQAKVDFPYIQSHWILDQEIEVSLNCLMRWMPPPHQCYVTRSFRLTNAERRSIHTDLETFGLVIPHNLCCSGNLQMLSEYHE